MKSEGEFLRILEEHKAIVLKVCKVYATSYVDRKDLEQEVIYQLWKSRLSFQGKSKLSTWMYRVALNTALVHFRKEQRRRQAAEEYALTPKLNDENTSQALERIYDGLKTLSKMERAIMLLFLEGYNLKEASEILGLSHSNSRVLMHRSKQKLKNLLNS